jgi:hypothetical protein
MFDPRNSNQSCRGTTADRPQMVGDFLQVKFSVLRVDTDPVQAHSGCDFAGSGRFHRHPQSECVFSISKFLPQTVAGVYAFGHGSLSENSRIARTFLTTQQCGSSWLNQVDLWFAKVEREVSACGIFTSVPDLAREPRRYINAYSAHARPIQWKYSDPSRRLRTNEFTATGH